MRRLKPALKKTLQAVLESDGDDHHAGQPLPPDAERREASGHQGGELAIPTEPVAPTMLKAESESLSQATAQEVVTKPGSDSLESGGRGVSLDSGLNQLKQRIEIVVVKPDYSDCRCPECGGETERVRSYYSHPWDAHLEHATVLEVYREIRRCKAKCGARRFAPELDFVEPDARYTRRVKHIAVASVVEDGMVIERVPERMRRDFHLPHLSGPSVHTWVHEAAGCVPPEGEYTRWVVERFSGVIGLDEVVMHDAHGNKQYLTVAVDSLNHRTIVFDLLESRDHDAVVKFLNKLKDMGIQPEVIITDMWKSYAGAMAEVFPAARQQLCVFHVIQDVMKHVNKAMLSYRRNLPKDTEAQKALRQELLDFRYTLLTSSHKLSLAQRERVEDILRQHAGSLLAEAYHLKEAVLALFRVSRTPEAARQRRDQIVQRFGHIREFKPILTLLSGESFEKMIVYLDYENLDKTNNDSERTNRTYQQGEKQRYRARTDQTRLNYVKLQARRRNRKNADRNERLKRKPPPAHSMNVDDLAQTTAHRLIA
jgi:transposase